MPTGRYLQNTTVKADAILQTRVHLFFRVFSLEELCIPPEKQTFRKMKGKPGRQYRGLGVIKRKFKAIQAILDSFRVHQLRSLVSQKYLGENL